MANAIYSSVSARKNRAFPRSVVRTREGNYDNGDSNYGDSDSVFDDELNFEDSFLLQDDKHALRNKLAPVLSSNAQVGLDSNNEHGMASDIRQGNYGVTDGIYDTTDGNSGVIDGEWGVTENELSLNLNPAIRSAADGSGSASASRLRKYVSSGSLFVKDANINEEFTASPLSRPHPSPADSIISLQRVLNKGVVVTEESLLSSDQTREIRESYDEMIDANKKFDSKHGRKKLEPVGDIQGGRCSSGHGNSEYGNSIRYSSSLSAMEEDTYLGSRLENQGEYRKENDSHSSTRPGSAYVPVDSGVRRPGNSTSSVTDDESSSHGEQSGDLA